MNIAKPSEKDLEAAGNLLQILHTLDSHGFPFDDESNNECEPDRFDPERKDHLRALYDALMGNLDKAPGFANRVIGGMVYAIMFEKNEIIDPDSHILKLHPRLERLAQSAEPTPAPASDELAAAIMVRQRLEQALIASRTGQGSHGPNYDGQKLSALVEDVIAGLSGAASDSDLQEKERQQRESMQARFDSRGASRATADFDLPAPNDEVK